MTLSDQERWDRRYAQVDVATSIGLPVVFEAYADVFPTRGHALELACGQGRAAVALARLGLDVVGVDISTVAIEQARALARDHGVDARCRFEQGDLDAGLPPGPRVNVLLCNKFRDSLLDREIVARLAPAGILAISVCSEVGVGPGPFRAAPGELRAAFGALEVIAEGEGDGQAWLLARGGG